MAANWHLTLPVCGVNFCWYDAMTRELSPLNRSVVRLNQVILCNLGICAIWDRGTVVELIASGVDWLLTAEVSLLV